MESEKRCASSGSSSSSSCASEDSVRPAAEDRHRLVKTEIEAAETLADLAHLAMRETEPETATDKWRKKGKRGRRRLARDSPPIPNDSVSGFPDLSLSASGDLAVADQLDEKISTTNSVETKKLQQDDCLRLMKVEQNADLPKPSNVCLTNYSLVPYNKSRRNLTEEEKEARRIRRVLANRESARQTIRRRQALCEGLTRKAATLMLENENLKREKEFALKEYQSLETTNKNLKAQIAKSTNAEVEKTAVEQEPSVAAVTNWSSNGPWFMYSHFPVTQLVWPSIIQSSDSVRLQHTPLSSVSMPLNVSVPCSSESDSSHKPNNLINDNQTQNPLYMFPCPWLFPFPEFGNRQPPFPMDLRDRQDELPLCGTSLSLNTVANMDFQAALPIKLKKEASGLTEARHINDPGHGTLRFPLDGSEQTRRCHTIEKFQEPSLGYINHVSAVKQELELQLHSDPNVKVSSTASLIVNSSLEKNQEQNICPGKNIVDAVAAADARRRRKELTRLKTTHGRQTRLHC